MPRGARDENVQKAVDKIRLLIKSQLALERKQAKMEAKGQTDGTAVERMAEIGETLEKLIGVAKKKGYIDQECTVQSLRAEVIQLKKESEQKDEVELMSDMKQRLDAQTTAVNNFLRDRQDQDSDWEEGAWAKLVNNNQDTLVIMQKLQRKGLISSDMITLATLPGRAPPRGNAPVDDAATGDASGAATRDASGAISGTYSGALPAATASASGTAPQTPPSGVVRGTGQAAGEIEPAGTPGFQSATTGEGGSSMMAFQTPSMMSGVQQTQAAAPQTGSVPMQTNGVTPPQPAMQHPGMMYPGMAMPAYPAMMHPYMMMPAHPGMLPPGMMMAPHPGMMPPPGAPTSGYAHSAAGYSVSTGFDNTTGLPRAPSRRTESVRSVVSGSKVVTEDDDSDESEEEINERLRELRGLEKERRKQKKMSKLERSEENLFKKNKGSGRFNNAFKVAEDIRQLGAVPEEEEAALPEAQIDTHMAKAMEERLLKGIEEEMLKDKQAIIKSFMKDSAESQMGLSRMSGNASAMHSAATAQNIAMQPMMQMQMMQQQQMMAMQSMMGQLSMAASNASMGNPSMMEGAGAPAMGTPSMMGSATPSMMSAYPAAPPMGGMMMPGYGMHPQPMMMAPMGAPPMGAHAQQMGSDMDETRSLAASQSLGGTGVLPTVPSLVGSVSMPQPVTSPVHSYTPQQYSPPPQQYSPSPQQYSPSPPGVYPGAAAHMPSMHAHVEPDSSPATARDGTGTSPSDGSGTDPSSTSMSAADFAPGGAATGAADSEKA